MSTTNPYSTLGGSYSKDEAMADTGLNDLTAGNIPACDDSEKKLVDTSTTYNSSTDLTSMTNLNTSGQFEMDGTFKWGSAGRDYGFAHRDSTGMLVLSDVLFNPTLAAVYPYTTNGISIGRSGSRFQYGYFSYVNASAYVETPLINSASAADLTLNGTTNNIVFKSAGTSKMIFNGDSIYPVTTATMTIGSSTQFFSTTYTNKIKATDTLTIDSPAIINNGADNQVSLTGSAVTVGLSGRSVDGQPSVNFNSSTYGNNYDAAIIASEGQSGTDGGGNLTVASNIFRVLGDQLAESGRGNMGAGYVGGFTRYQGTVSNQALSALTWANVYNFTVPTTGNVIIFGNIQISSLTTAGVQSAGISTETGEVSGYVKGTAYGTTTCPACIQLPPTFDYGGAATTYYLNVMSSSDQSACYITYNFVVLNIN